MNRDGILSKQDARDCMEVFVNYYRNRVDEESLAEMREGLRQFWEELIFRKIAHKDTISRDEFVASLTEEFQTDPQGLRDELSRIVPTACKAVDVNHNGFLSYDEFAILFKAFGTTDENLIRETYQHYQPSDKGVEVAKYVESWIDWVIGEDKEKENMAIKGYFSQV